MAQDLSLTLSTETLPHIVKRDIFPIVDWDNFLNQGKREFLSLYAVKGAENITAGEFNFYCSLGNGRFGVVVLAKSVIKDIMYAIKVVEKTKTISLDQISRNRQEKRILQALNCPFAIPLEFFFMDSSFLYYGMQFMPGGDLFHFMKKSKKFEERISKFYAAQVVLAIEYLHYMDLIYRDLKPENVLIDSKGYIKLTDFSFTKMVPDDGRTYSTLGTPEYQAPEIILQKGYGKAVDWWAFGVFLFEITEGVTPFHGKDILAIYTKVLECSYKMPRRFSDELKHLVDSSLELDLSRRISNLNGGAADIRAHPWFKDVDFMAILNGKVEAPTIPILQDPLRVAAGQVFKIATADLYKNEFDEF